MSFETSAEDTQASKHGRLAEHERLSSIIATQNDIYSAEVDLDGVMRLVAKKAQTLSGADGGVIEMSLGDIMVYRAVSGNLANYLGTRVPIAGSLAGMCVEAGQILHCEDSEIDPRVNREICRRMNARSLIVVPLKHERRNVGVLEVTSERANAFGLTDVETLELLSSLLGAAISRAADHDANLKLFSEREEALAAVEEQAALLRGFFDSSPSLMVVLQREGFDFRYLAVNAPAAALFQRTEEDMRGKSGLELGLPEALLKGVQPYYDEAERSRRPVHFEYTLGESSDTKFMAATVCALAGTAGRFAVTVEDVTERTQLRERLDLSERMVSVGRLAAGVAHEANNPLAYVVSNLNYLEDELGGLLHLLGPQQEKEIREALKETKSGADRVQAIIKDLYLFSRAHTEDTQPVALREVLERTLPMATLSLRYRARLVRDFGSAPLVLGNEGRLGQVMLNLVMNAGQAIPEGNAEANSVTVRTGTLSDGQAMVEVADTGSGISPENLKRIFDPFFTTKPIGEGMGLGLSTCHAIVVAHGGELTVRSVEGKGTTFRVTLPAAAPTMG